MLQIHERQYNRAFQKKASRFVLWKKNLSDHARKATMLPPQSRNLCKSEKRRYLVVFKG